MAFPKLYPSVAQHNAAVRAHFAANLSRPVVIVGNGPSSAQPFEGRVPSDALIFRMNWFFLEEAKTYGHRVDGYFWSIDVPALQDELAAIAQRKDYELRAFFSPMWTTVATKDGPVIDQRLQPAFDHWALLAEQPTFARELMGRPLPTQGFQVLAFALALGFRDIYLSGIDLYDSAQRRYAYTIPDRIARALPSKDLTPGYESAHARDRDLAFFDTCRKLFPEAKLTAASDSAFLREFVPSPGEPKRRIQAAPKLPPFLPNVITLPNGDRRAREELTARDRAQIEKVIDGKRCAFVTLCVGDGFLYGIKALARSLSKVSDVPLVVMCAPETQKEGLLAPNVVLYDVLGVENPNKLHKGNQRYKHVYSKLAAFGLTPWDRLVYIDADALVLQNIDDLFAIDEFAAAPDLGCDLNYHIFNSGLFCCQPSEELLERMLNALSSTKSYDGGDQGFLNEFFPTPRILDRNYNVLKRLLSHHPNLFRLEDVKMLHYAGNKPWEWPVAGGDEKYSDLDRLWCNFLTQDELFELLRTRPPLAAPAPKAEASPTATSEALGRINGEQAIGREQGVLLRKFRKLQRDPKRFWRDSPLGKWMKEE